jgi:hypothetical protein
VRNLHYIGINPTTEISTLTLRSLVNICSYFRGFTYLYVKVFDYSDSEEADRTLLQNYGKSLQRTEHHSLPDLTDDAYQICDKPDW